MLRHFLCLGVWLIGAIPANADDALLDELLAGHDANVSAINHGTARYRYTATAGGHRSEFLVEVQFHGDQTRFDFGDSRNISSPDADITFEAPHLGTAAARPPHHYIAIVYEKGRGPNHPWQYHPRYLGHSHIPNSQTLGDVMREVQKAARQSKAFKWKAERGAGAASVSYVHEYVTLDFRLGPGSSFPIIDFSMTDSRLARPAAEAHFEYRTVSTGQQVASKATIVSRIPQAHEYVDRARVEVELMEIDLTKRPDPEVFTLGGLGVPIGARISDKRIGKIYLFGVEAATEKELVRIIEEQELTHLYGPAPVESWTWTIGISVSLAILALGLVLLLGWYLRAAR